MSRVSGWLWAACAGGVLAAVSLGSSFYVHEGEVRDAWFGIPHASQLLLAAALITWLLTASLVSARNPLRGSRIGVVVGAAGTLATLHLSYRMAAPPFDFGELPQRMTILDVATTCLGYCPPGQAADVQLLPGIYLAVAGATLIALGGWGHAVRSRGREVAAAPPRVADQRGLTPWLGVAGLGAVGQFLFSSTVFTFFLVAMDDGGQRIWSGWYAMPHTAVLVLWSTAIVVGLVVTAARHRAPLRPQTLGVVVALLGLLAASRLAARMVDSPSAEARSPPTSASGPTCRSPPRCWSSSGAVCTPGRSAPRRPRGPRHRSDRPGRSAAP